MQGAGLLTETLAQYSALMVLERLRGEGNIRRFLQFQLDRYLSGRRTQVLEEQPLASAGLDQDYVNYGKGALALYLLQQRMGEAAVNRALRRFVERYRFTTAPLSALHRPDRLASRGSGNPRAAGADHRSVRAHHPLRAQGRSADGRAPAGRAMGCDGAGGSPQDSIPTAGATRRRRGWPSRSRSASSPPSRAAIDFDRRTSS